MPGDSVLGATLRLNAWTQYVGPYQGTKYTDFSHLYQNNAGLELRGIYAFLKVIAHESLHVQQIEMTNHVGASASFS